MKKPKQKIIDNDVSTTVVQLGEETRSKACDWSTDCIPAKFAANRKPALRKRHREQESEIPDYRTKQIQP